jgi:molecular chaperone HtpG
MVADRIAVVTRRAGTEEVTRWESTGDGSYTLGPAERPAAGTANHPDFTQEVAPNESRRGTKALP